MVSLLAVSVGLALIMLTVHSATDDQLSSVSGQIGTEITVRPAGSFEGQGGSNPQQDADVNILSAIPHVTAAEKMITTRYSGPSLQSPIEPGTLGPGGSTCGNFQLSSVQRVMKPGHAAILS